MNISDLAVFNALKEAFPSLDESHFLIMKQTKHPYWEQAVTEVRKRTNEIKD